MKLLYTLKEFAALTGQSPDAVRQQCQNGYHSDPAPGVPGAFKFGCEWRVPAAYVSYLEGGLVRLKSSSSSGVAAGG